jgi:hypothetical protein
MAVARMSTMAACNRVARGLLKLEAIASGLMRASNSASSV